MLIPQDFFNACDPSYQAVISKLDADFFATEDNEKKIQLFEDFSSRYLMPKEYWNAYLEPLNWLWSISEEKCESFALKGIYHLYYDPKQQVYTSDGFYRKILKLSTQKFDLITPQKAVNYLRSASTFPNRSLKKCLCLYEEFATSLPSKAFYKRHEEMQILHDKIQASKDDLETWFQLLFEAGDEEFVIHSIEYRLGSNLLDKNLWKIYVKYLKQKNDPTKMLHLWSKYCRFFLDDSEAKAEYEAEFQKNSAALPWKNLFGFEIDSCEWHAIYDQEKAENRNSSYDASLPDSEVNVGEVAGRFFDNIAIQEFSLPKPMILYILENSGHPILRKFFQCSKNFFLRQKTPICYGIELSTENRPQDGSAEFTQEFLLLDPRHPISPSIKNLHLTTSLQARVPYSDNQFLASLIPRLSKSDLKYCKIGHQNLKFSELKFLIRSGNVEKMDIFVAKITHDESGENVPVEEILALTPKIRHFQLSHTKLTPITVESIVSQKFENKIKWFHLYDIDAKNFDVNLFKEFVIKNMAKTFELGLHFLMETTTVENLMKFAEIMKDPKHFNQKSIGRMQIQPSN